MARVVVATIFVMWWCGLSVAAEPAAGDWLEYVVAYPVDPLENSLRPIPLPSPLMPREHDPEHESQASPDAPVSRFSPVLPEFEAPTVWRTLPLRVSIAGRADGGFNVIVNLDGNSSSVILPFASARQPTGDPDGTANQKIGDMLYNIQVFRDSDPETGFIRHVSEELPFGLARFATPYVDVILVDMGSGEEPPFPSTRVAVSPPPGTLWSTRR